MRALAARIGGTMGTLTLAGGVAVLVALAAPTPAGAQDVERYAVSGDHVAVFNLAGSVRVEAGSGSEVTVEVRRGGGDAGRLRVVTGEVAGMNALRVVYPADRIVYPEMGRRSRTELRVRADGTFGLRDRGGEGERVRITGSGGGLEAYADLLIRVPRGRAFRLHQGVGEIAVEGVEGEIVVDGTSTRVTATRVRGSLSVDVGSGSVDVSDAEGEVHVDTGSGSVRLSDVRGPSLHVDTGSGSVTARGISAEDVHIDTGSGGIDVAALTVRTARLDTGSGSVDVALDADVDELVIDTGSGSVTVAVPESLGAEIEIETGSGGIDLRFPVSVRRVERDEIRGTIGDGRGRIVIDTGSGSVTLRRP